MARRRCCGSGESWCARESRRGYGVGYLSFLREEGTWAGREDCAGGTCRLAMRTASPASALRAGVAKKDGQLVEGVKSCPEVSLGCLRGRREWISSSPIPPRRCFVVDLPAFLGNRNRRVQPSPPCRLPASFRPWYPRPPRRFPKDTANDAPKLAARGNKGSGVWKVADLGCRKRGSLCREMAREGCLLKVECRRAERSRG